MDYCDGLLVFASGSFYAASKHHATENVLLQNHLNRFLLGMIMSAVILIHFAFWLGWSSVLFAKKILHHSNLHFGVFILAIGLGTFVANDLFIYGGRFITRQLAGNDHLINVALGWMFVGTAFIQAGKILWTQHSHKSNATVLTDPHHEK